MNSRDKNFSHHVMQIMMQCIVRWFHYKSDLVQVGIAGNRHQVDNVSMSNSPISEIKNTNEMHCALTIESKTHLRMSKSCRSTDSAINRLSSCPSSASANEQFRNVTVDLRYVPDKNSIGDAQVFLRTVAFRFSLFGEHTHTLPRIVSKNSNRFRCGWMAAVALGNELTPQNICFVCGFRFVTNVCELSIDLSRSVTITFNLDIEMDGIFVPRRIASFEYSTSSSSSSSSSSLSSVNEISTHLSLIIMSYIHWWISDW